MSPHELVLSVALGVSLLGSILLFYAPGPCRCEKCGYHVNERRMERERQKELQHDTAHRGFGWRVGDPDLYRCTDDECPRNPKKSG